MRGIIAALQLLLTVLGASSIVLGVIALVFSNRSRAADLLISGFSILCLNYFIGLVYTTVSLILTSKTHRQTFKSVLLPFL